MAVVSCSLPEQELTTLFQEGQPVQFSAYNGEDAPSTKTLLIQDGYLDNGQPQMITWWSAHDEIGIFYGASSVNRFVSNNTEPVKKAMFEGTLNAFTGQTESGDFNYFWAVYPYDSAVSCDGSSVTAVLAHNQVATIGTYAPKTNVTIAKSAGLSLAFYNTCSFFRFSVAKEGIQSVTFKGNNNEYVAGKFSISMGSDGKPTTPTIVEGKKEITLTAPNNGTFEVGEPYYFVLLPQTFTKGFTVTFKAETEVGVRTIDANASFPRNQINFSNGAFDQNVVYSPIDCSTLPLCFEALEDGQVAFYLPGPGRSLKYKKNDSEWTNWDRYINVKAGDRVYFKGNNCITIEDEFDTYIRGYLYGNILSLVDADNYASLKELPSTFNGYQLFLDTKILSHPTLLLVLPATTLVPYCYRCMFENCTLLTRAPELPATSLSDYCYSGMFNGCTSLQQAPELPVYIMTDNCYSGMFGGCTSLVNAPDLPASSLANSCYSGMFSGCTSLVNAPKLPATTLADYCYMAMFQGCTSLTYPPNLSAKTLADYCYCGMFVNCSSISSAPALPATTINQSCYYLMFSGCTSLVNAPTLQATTMTSMCYQEMFKDCTSLVNAPALPANVLAYSCYEGMFSGCTSLLYAPGLELPAEKAERRCYKEMFKGCGSLIRGPWPTATTLAESCYESMFADCGSLTNIYYSFLPAETLAKNCYKQMFSNCTSLQKAPSLIATNLTQGCYEGLFCGCSKLSKITALFTTQPGDNYTKGWVSGVSASGTFIKDARATWSVWGDNGIPNGWTVDY